MLDISLYVFNVSMDYTAIIQQCMGNYKRKGPQLLSNPYPDIAQLVCGGVFAADDYGAVCF